VLYDWVMNSHGEKLRTFVTRPSVASLKQAAGKVPVIFFVGWLSCDSMEYPDAKTKDGFGILIRRLIDESGFATVRMDKPGVGESQGDCAKADFESEMSGWQAAFAAMSKYDFMDRDRVIVLGMSNGGGFAPLVARGPKSDDPMISNRGVRGFVACGSWGRTWYEHMIELERRRLTDAGTLPAVVNSEVKAFAEFYDLYLAKGMTPGQVLEKHPEWKSLWYDSADGQYGRPAAFYQQLQALNLGEVWQQVGVPVLVIRGRSDTIMSRADSQAIEQIVNQVHPGQARYMEMEGMTHGFMEKDKFAAEVVPMILAWMRERVGDK
jgi:pimeloyl-ACP methyl ester carboxylesterase